MNKKSLCIKRHKDMTLKDETPPRRHVDRCTMCYWERVEDNS